MYFIPHYVQINKTVTEHKKLVETSGRLQRMVPDKDAFLENLHKARQAAHEVRNTSYTMYLVLYMDFKQKVVRK